MEERKRKRSKRLKSHGGVEQRSALEDEMASPPLYRNGEENQSSPSLSLSRVYAPTLPSIRISASPGQPPPSTSALYQRVRHLLEPSHPPRSRPLCSRNPQEFHFVCQPNYTPQFYTFPFLRVLHPSPNHSFGKDGRKNSIAPFASRILKILILSEGNCISNG